MQAQASPRRNQEIEELQREFDRLFMEIQKEEMKKTGRQPRSLARLRDLCSKFNSTAQRLISEYSRTGNPRAKSIETLTKLANAVCEEAF